MEKNTENLDNPVKTNYKLLILGAIIAAIILALLFIFQFKFEAGTSKAQEPKPELPNKLVQFKESIIILNWQGNSSSFAAISGKGSILFFDKTPNEKGDPSQIGKFQLKEAIEADPLTSSASGAILSAAFIDESSCLAGSDKGQVIYFQKIGNNWTRKVLHTFRDTAISDPVASAGSVTNILISPDKNQFITVNYDGKALVWKKSQESKEIIYQKGLYFSSGINAGGYLNSNSFWITTNDGQLQIFDLISSQPIRSTSFHNFGTVAGGDVSASKTFLIYGESVESETPVVELYDETGKFFGSKTFKANNQAPRRNGDYSLSQSFKVVRWLNNNSFVAGLNKDLFIFNLMGDKVKKITLSEFVPSEEIMTLLPTSPSSILVATNLGNIFEIVVENK